jgi:hypothetical protein
MKTKTLDYVFLLFLLTLVCCSQEDSQTLPIGNNNAEITELTLDTKNASNGRLAGNSLGFIYKKSIWLKNNAAIQISRPAGKAIIYNPKLWTVVEYQGHLTAYDAASIGDAGCDCGPNQVCINGECTSVTPCGGGCPAGSTCINGICTQNSPCGGSCPAGQTCVNGICTPNDPCGNCGPDETCINGTCQPNDPCANCGPNETCINGTCQPDPCDDCDDDEICVNGDCQPTGEVDDIGQIETF